MRLGARVRQLEARGVAAPALVREWVAFLTLLRERCAFTSDDGGPLFQYTDAAIAAEARYYAGRGIPATIGDWFGHLRDVAADEGGDDATTHTA